MMRFIRNLFGAESKPIRRKNRRPAASRRLGLEGLETRDLMAVGFTVLPQQIATAQLEVVAPAAVEISIQNKDLYIRGTDGADDVKVAYQGSGKYTVTVTTEVNGRAVSKSTTWKPTGGDVFFYGNRGNDKFLASFSSGGYLHVTADGGDGDDNITGSWGKDNLKGGNGRDMLIGQSNDDKLDGGLGPDYLDGRDGNDTLVCGNDYEANIAFGGIGNDKITGSYGSDELNGGGGNDTIDGSLGEDYLFGNDGNDTLFAGNDASANYLEGGNGNDYLCGADGNDTLLGQAGNDWLFGYGGNDLLYSGSGFDKLYAGAGDDKLYGNATSNSTTDFFGEEGKDTFYITYSTHIWPVYYDSPPGLDAEPGESVFEGN